MAKKSYFGSELFQFLRELEKNNNKDWFLANQQRYETTVREPPRHFVGDFGPRLHKISSYYVADPRPVGGSVIRINRDTRFSADKSPYKTMALSLIHI